MVRAQDDEFDGPAAATPKRARTLSLSDGEDCVPDDAVPLSFGRTLARAGGRAAHSKAARAALASSDAHGMVRSVSDHGSDEEDAAGDEDLDAFLSGLAGAVGADDAALPLFSAGPPFSSFGSFGLEAPSFPPKPAFAATSAASVSADDASTDHGDTDGGSSDAEEPDYSTDGSESCQMPFGSERPGSVHRVGSASKHAFAFGAPLGGPLGVSAFSFGDEELDDDVSGALYDFEPGSPNRLPGTGLSRGSGASLGSGRKRSKSLKARDTAENSDGGGKGRKVPASPLRGDGGSPVKGSSGAGRAGSRAVDRDGSGARKRRRKVSPEGRPAGLLGSLSSIQAAGTAGAVGAGCSASGAPSGKGGKSGGGGGGSRGANLGSAKRFNSEPLAARVNALLAKQRAEKALRLRAGAASPDALAVAQAAGEELAVRGSVVTAFLHCRASNVLDGDSWRALVDSDKAFVLNLPPTPYRACLPPVASTPTAAAAAATTTASAVASGSATDKSSARAAKEAKAEANKAEANQAASGARRVCGVDALIADTASLAGLLETIRSRAKAVKPECAKGKRCAASALRLAYEVDAAALVAGSGDRLMGPWVAGTSGLVACGFASEVTVKGMLSCTFSPSSHKLVSVDLTFDAASFSAQLAAAGLVDAALLKRHSTAAAALAAQAAACSGGALGKASLATMANMLGHFPGLLLGGKAGPAAGSAGSGCVSGVPPAGKVALGKGEGTSVPLAAPSAAFMKDYMRAVAAARAANGPGSGPPTAQQVHLQLVQINLQAQKDKAAASVGAHAGGSSGAAASATASPAPAAAATTTAPAASSGSSGGSSVGIKRPSAVTEVGAGGIAASTTLRPPPSSSNSSSNTSSRAPAPPTPPAPAPAAHPTLSMQLSHFNHLIGFQMQQAQQQQLLAQHKSAASSRAAAQAQQQPPTSAQVVAMPNAVSAAPTQVPALARTVTSSPGPATAAAAAGAAPSACLPPSGLGAAPTAASAGPAAGSAPPLTAAQVAHLMGLMASSTGTFAGFPLLAGFPAPPLQERGLAANSAAAAAAAAPSQPKA